MKKFLAILFTFILGLLCFAGCTDNKKDDNLIRLNEVTHSIFYAPLYLAMSAGYFEDEGLTVELTNGGGADKSMTALLTKDADIGLMGPEAAIYVYLEGREDYVTVFGQLTKRDGSFLVARNPKTGDEFDYSTMEGSTFIIGRKGGVPAMTAEYVLKQKGLINGENITFNFDIQFNMMAGAFIGGESGDFVTLFEPTATELQNAGQGYIVASIGEDSGEVPYTAFMATKSYIRDNPEKVEKFLRAVYRAMTEIETGDEDEISAYLEEHFPDTSRESIKIALQSYKRIDAWMKTPVMKEESFERLQTIMTEAGELTEKAPFDKLIDNSIAEKIIAG